MFANTRNRKREEKMLRTTRQILWKGIFAAFFGTVGVVTFALVGTFAGAQQAPAKSAAATAPNGKAFSSPEEAADAVHFAAKKNDEAALMDIFGTGSKEMVVWGNDSNERRNERADFAQRYEQMHRLVTEPDGTVTLYVGAENWPVPIPLVEINGHWYFDAEAGKQEILYRRIGRNELEALEVCHALLDAEKDYYSTAHAYTAKFISTSGSHDGLYWTGSGPKSPIGPYLAHAGLDPSAGTHTPYHGYYYRILSPTAGDFDIVAFPAEYRSSGVVTFVIDEMGNTYEKDLGPKTDAVARQMKSFGPDNTWMKTE